MNDHATHPCTDGIADILLDMACFWNAVKRAQTLCACIHPIHSRMLIELLVGDKRRHKFTSNQLL